MFDGRSGSPQPSLRTRFLLHHTTAPTGRRRKDRIDNTVAERFEREGSPYLPRADRVLSHGFRMAKPS